MNKFLFATAVLGTFILSGCQPAPVQPTPPATPPAASQPTPPPVSEPAPPLTPPSSSNTACKTDADCVPTPSQCHSHSCVSTTAAAGMDKVQICTMMFDNQAAYGPEDCTCQNSVCVNKNLGRTGDTPEIKTVQPETKAVTPPPIKAINQY